MTAILFLVVLVALFLSGAHAEPQSKTFYNDRGQEIGRSEKRGGSTIYLDEKGARTGHSEKRGDGTTIYYDERGLRIGTTKERSR
jgi:hypothetical protein